MMIHRRTRLAVLAILLFAPLIHAHAQAAASQLKGNRALVLGGGGPVGGAWETALVAGLAEKGVDLSHADLIVGTSAGSVVGAQLALGHPPSEILEDETQRIAAPLPAAAGPAPNLMPLGIKMTEMLSGKGSPEQIRAQLGAWALTAHPIVSADVFVSLFEGLFPGPGWTATPYECTTVDVATGEFKVWSKDSAVPLASAVASSCAVPGIFAPVEIGGHRYMDGGMRSPTNADVAKGYGVVVVIDVNAGPETSDLAREFGAVVRREIKLLEDGGSKVELIVPDAASLKAFGPNLMDPRRRAQALAAGIDQGHAEVERLSPIWNH